MEYQSTLIVTWFELAFAVLAVVTIFQVLQSRHQHGMKLLEGGLGWYAAACGLLLVFCVFTIDLAATLLSAGSPASPSATEQNESIRPHILALCALVGTAAILSIRRFNGSSAQLADPMRPPSESPPGEKAFHDLIELIPDAVMIQCDGKLEQANASAVQRFGAASEKELIGMDTLKFVHPDFRDIVLDFRNDAIDEHRTISSVEVQHQRLDGSNMVSEVSIGPLDWKGRTGTITIIRDITDRIEAEREARRANAALNALLEHAPCSIRMRDLDDRYILVNRQFAANRGVSPEDLIGRLASEVAEPEELERTREHVVQILQTDERVDYEFAGKGRLHGKFFTATSFPVRDENGEMLGIGGIVLDVTERTKAENALRENEELLRGIFDNSPSLIHLKDRDGKFRFANQRFEEWYGVKFAEMIGKTSHDLFPENIANQYTGQDRELLRSGAVQTQELESPFADGSTHILLNTKFPVLGTDGQPAGIGTIATDITDLKVRETELSENRVMMQTILDTVPALITLRDSEGRIVYSNKLAAEYYGSSVDDVLGRTTDELVSGHFVDPFAEVRRTGQPYSNPDVPSVLHPGKKFWLLGAPIVSENDEFLGVLIVSLDVTEQRDMEEQLRQSQKMEIVGQLTGGVAHDFNNLLGIIIGNLDLLEAELGVDSELRDLVDPAIRAALSGSELNRQLMAFSRQQSLSPRVVDLNQTVSQLLGMLRRVLGETIEIEANQSDGLWLADVDPAQVESALVNLAVNARDAMPDGGKLTVETSNVSLDDDYAAAQAEVTSGEYVMLALTDTGTGMSQEVLEHVFEPFFTTKEAGRGTGLGLSMVFGFAKQSGGHITIYSEVGEGTTVKLYLPRAQREAELGDVIAERVPAARGETVLVVEDDPDLRTLIVTMLEDLEYGILEAGNGESALRVLRETASINLLLTDVVLPAGMGGPEIAEAAREINPAIKVLFMSGYPRDAATRQSRVAEGEVLLEKPFRMVEFARKLRQAIDAD